jgi:fumarylacetoacetase
MAHALLVPMTDARLVLPAQIGSFTDFLTSIYHTERGGRVTRPDSPIPPPFRHLPIAYNGRATSVRASGEDVRRPNGQWRRADGTVQFGPCEQLDFELEVGMFVGRGNALGEPVAIDDATSHMFGYCLLNDWSARDIQRWESALGPFLGKSLSTTISCWVVTAEALAPFRAPAFPRPPGDPAPLPYLHGTADQAQGGLDLTLEAYLETPRMRRERAAPARITRTNFIHMYWTFAQMLTHHMSNGCNLRPGDLLGSGTASGPLDENRACLSEITGRGAHSFALPNGESRIFLEDGDEVIFRARAERAGFVQIGFGECRARVVSAPPWPAPRSTKSS